MRDITIKSSVRAELVEMLPMLIDKAILWLRNKYPNTNFNKIDFIFSGSARSSSYCRRDCFRHEIRITTRSKIVLYYMATLGMKKKHKAIHGGCEVQIMTALIHELTHHHQYENGLPTGELLTTANELEYLKEYHPSIYKKFMK